MKKLILIVSLILSFKVFAQETFTIMQYNLTYYGNTASFVNCNNTNNSVANKNSYLKTIIDEVQPDILGVNELGFDISYANSIRDNALNTSGRTFYDKTILNGFGDIANLLYYNKDKFGIYSEDVIDKELDGDWITRAIDVHTLYYKAPDLVDTKDTVYLTFIVAHLKAGSNASDLSRRDDATAVVMSYLDNTNVKGSVFIMGDFNIKSSSDDAFQNLINYSNPDLNFVDPINQLGNWSSNSSYAAIHTQSTRDSDNNGGCFVSGGMDDRYDFILMENSMLNSSSKVKYVVNSYKAYGNDGSSYNGDLNTASNSVVSNEVAQALYNMSDHLPVVMDIEISNVTSISQSMNSIDFQFSNPLENEIVIKAKNKGVLNAFLIDLSGKMIFTQQFSNFIIIPTSILNSGMYFLKIENKNGDFVIKKVVK